MHLNRSRLALLLLAVLGLIGVVAPPARAADITMLVGENRLVLCEFDCPAALVNISPANAGTVIDSTLFAPSLVFTPALSFRGVATLTTSNGEIVTIEVIAPTNASSSGTFTPVGAPGPCLILVAGAAVSFGDVRVGGPVASGDASPTLRGCAPTEVVVDLAVSAADATGAGGTISNVGSTCVDSIATPAPGCDLTGASFVVEVGGVRADSGVASVLPFTALPGDFLNTSYTVQLLLSGGVPASQQGSPFSFAMTFTAIPSTP